MISPADWEEIEQLFHQALDLPAERRGDLLASARGPIRAEVESLLRADEETFFSSPPVHLAADLVDAQPTTLAPGQRVDEYIIDSLITVGGMGEVYLAHHSGETPVALKILRRHLIASPHAVDRFQTEARAASALHHPNIITLRDSGESAAGLFMAMEWINGPTFRKVIDAGPIATVDAIDWCAQAALGLAAAHAAGILHRDIKPDNIMLDGDGVLKILDFGLARLAGPVRLEPDAMGASGTISGTLSGTLLYMPPEILRGETATSASDVFSLGALFYEIWTGRHPFAGETPLDVFEAIECREVEPPSTIRPHMPQELEAPILRMLDRNPSRRPSAAEVCEIFNRFSVRP